MAHVEIIEWDRSRLPNVPIYTGRCVCGRAWFCDALRSREE